MVLKRNPKEEGRNDGGGSGHETIAVAPSVRVVTPYDTVTSQAAIEAAPDHRTCFKLDWNECTVDPSPRVREAIREWVCSGRGLNWYPRLGSSRLARAVADYTGLDTTQLLVTSGSDAALRLICSTYLDGDDHVVVPVPTYHHFMIFARSRGARLETVCGASAFEPCLEAIEGAMTSQTRLVYLVSPNNPTGVIYPPEWVAQLCRDYPNSLVVLDEAYYEFARMTGIGFVGEVTNLVVTRTFSKAFGLAGLRVGYLAGATPVIEGLGRLYNPKSVNAVAQVGAAAALEDLDYLVSFLAEVEASKDLIRDFFASRDGVELRVTPANFVVLRVEDVASTIDELGQRGVYVRDRSHYPGMEGCLRMSVGTRTQTRRLLRRVDDVFR